MDSEAVDPDRCTVSRSTTMPRGRPPRPAHRPSEAPPLPTCASHPETSTATIALSVAPSVGGTDGRIGWQPAHLSTGQQRRAALRGRFLGRFPPARRERPCSRFQGIPSHRPGAAGRLRAAYGMKTGKLQGPRASRCTGAVTRSVSAGVDVVIGISYAPATRPSRTRTPLRDRVALPCEPGRCFF